MRSEINRRKLFTRRAFILGGAKSIAFIGLASRLYYLQFIRGQEYTVLSNDNRVKLLLLTPERGHILDRNAVELAVNEDNFRALLDPELFPELEETVESVGKLIALPADALTALQRKISRDPNMPLLLMEHLSWEDVAKLEVHSLDLPGVFIDVGKMRHYPYADMTAHVTGYVGAVAEDDPTAKQLARLPDLKIGKKGVEKAREEDLRGTPGVKHVEVNAVGVSIRELKREESKRGEDVKLSLDMRIQEFTYNRLAKERSASCVVMNAISGEVLTLATYPSFDPNQFAQGISTQDWDTLIKNPSTPLLNKAIAGQYPPGSTFKTLVALEGLQSGLVNPSTHYYCPGHFDLGNHRFHCWKHEGHGNMDMATAIERSCDVYFYNVGLLLGVDRFAEMAKMFGLGKETGVEIPGELPGLIPTQEWKRKRLKQPWQSGDSVNSAIGQGYVLSTPLQLAVQAARIGTGRAVKPTMFPAAEDKEPFPLLPVSEEKLNIVRDGMRRVVNVPTGTAYAQRMVDPAMAMAGKTGTSQVRRIRQGVDNKTEDWENRHHALFIAYAPIHRPTYSCCVVVEHGASGSGAAAPIAKEVLTKTQELLGVIPIDASLPWLKKTGDKEE